MSHITLAIAKEMTDLYRQERKNILADNYKEKDTLAYSETFDVNEVQAIVNQPGCTKVRVYYGMDANLRVHAVLIGVNQFDQDILPGIDLPMGITNIIEQAVRCPEVCPPSSPLNT